MMDLVGYEVLDTLAERETAILLRARRSGDQQRVVIKLLRTEHPTPEDVARVHHEYAIAAGLRVEGVLRPERVERFGHRIGLVLEDIGGMSLRAAIPPAGMEIGTFLRLAISLARTVGALHEADVIHRDVKPANVIVDPLLSTVKLADFGIATRLPRLHQESAPPGRLEGTLAYISPEQTGRMNRSVDHRSDLYALGVTYYQMLTGRLPFQASDALEIVHCHLAVPPRPPSELSPAVPSTVSDVVLRLLAKSPEDRYQSAYGLAWDLQACLDQWEATAGIEPFTIGARDVPGRFEIPERLYGRETEIAALLDIFADVAGGHTALVLLSGAAGIGKTALVGEVQAPIVERRGYFSEGKFDQYSGNVPYASLLDAFGGLVRQLLGEPADRIAAWRQRILDALNTNVGVVAQVIPELRLIVGEPPPVAQLGPTETQNRFNLVFRQFISVFAQAEHPLVVFLDDLHWADVASLKLLATLLTDPDVGHLLMVGAYRPREVSESHPLTVTVDALDPALVHRIDVGPLAEDTVADLVADTLFASPTEVGPLASFLHDRAGGNPFFLRQLLSSLSDDGLVQFEAGHWSWDLGKIREHGLTDDVVEFMVARVAALAPETQEVLRLAAVIGNRFDLGTMTTVLERPAADIAAQLWGALRAGLVLPVGEAHELVGAGAADAELPDVAYRFLHDRVQQACHSTIRPADVPAVHLRVGELLLSRLDGDGEGLFEVIQHLNAGAGLIVDARRRLELAGLNVRAARKAKASTAYDSAAQLLAVARQLLPDGAWSEAYDLVLELHLLEGEALVVLGRIDEAERVFGTLLQSVRTDADFAAACEVRAEMMTCAGRMPEAYAAARAGLARLGVSLPESAEEVAAQSAVLVESLLDLSIVQRLESLDPAAEQAVLMARLFEKACMSAYFAQPQDLAFFMGKGLEHVLRHGFTPYSGIPIGFFAASAVRQGHMELGVAYAEVATKLAERSGDPFMRGRVMFAAWFFCLGWEYSFEDNHRALQETFFLCQSAGDLQFANHALLGLYLNALAQGRDCAETLERVERWLDHGEKLAPLAAGQCRIRIDCMKRLIGVPCEPLDVEAIVRAYDALGDRTDECESHMELTRHLALVGDYPAAYEHAVRAEPAYDLGSAGTGLWCILYEVGYAVAAARLSTTTDRSDVRASHLAKVDELLERVRTYAAPGRFSSYASLVAAERWRAMGDVDAATLDYLRAIDQAGAHGHVLLEAWANELLARLYRERGFRFAVGHLIEAKALYLECGAKGKALRLEEEFPELAAVPVAVRRFDETRTTTDHGTSQLDLATVIKASQAIAGEIAFDRVLARLIAISVENAGAERGIFVAAESGILTVEAEGRAGAVEVREHGSLPLSAASDLLPTTLVHYVARARRPVVLADATRDETFGHDAYVRAHKPKSALGLPIVRNNTLVGVLYLENTLLEGAFTPERLELLRLLSAQMAISLENAGLYARLEQKVRDIDEFNRALVRFVPPELTQLLGKGSIVDVSLGDHVERDMAVLFSDLRSFTTLCERLSPQDAFRFVNAYLERVGPLIRAHHGFIDKYMGDALLAIFPAGADDALRAAIAMQETVDDLNAGKELLEGTPLRIRIGIGVHAGPLILGVIGEQERMEGTVIADAVNLAARLQGLCKDYGVRIVTTDGCLARTRDGSAYASRPLGMLPIRGKADGIAAFEVFDCDPPEVRTRKRSTAAAIGRGLQYLARDDLEEAAAELRSVVEIIPDDPVALDLLAQATLRRRARLLGYEPLTPGAG